MNENTLILTVGLPQSGKSTWAKTLNYPIINPDSIRLAVHGKPFIALAEPLVWAIAKIMVDALFLAGHKNLILDATNTTQKRRNEWKSKKWKTVFKCFPEGKQVDVVDVCKKRALANKREDLVSVIDRMANQFEPLIEDENSNRL